MDSVFTQLDREWIALIRRPSTANELTSACAMAGASRPDQLVAAVRRAAPEAADPVMARLARQAHDGSDIAARALLQLLLPGTCRLAARWWALGSSEERAAAAVAAVYARIRRYPLDRRPRKIAANILLDANQDLARLARRAVADRQSVAPLEPRCSVGGSRSRSRLPVRSSETSSRTRWPLVAYRHSGPRSSSRRTSTATTFPRSLGGRALRCAHCSGDGGPRWQR